MVNVWTGHDVKGGDAGGADVMTVHNFPVNLTSFVGRDKELAQITERLADEACRLLTLVGPGGVGKTRLAVETAVRQQDAFSHGVYFVPLQSASGGEMLITTIADALALSLSGPEAPLKQLQRHLQERSILLLLDNFEQLVGASNSEEESAAPLLAAILESAPGVKLLVTSREAIHLRAEWLYPVQGLSYPEDETAENLMAYGAVRLFVERAQQVRPQFSAADVGPSVIRICRLVGGLPLALEMAASWTKMLACAAIADEIERNLDFLSTQMRNVPQRHRSMRAVFDQTWQLLSGAERDAFMRLAVFRGDFERGAAEAVSGASLPLLLGLVDKSLLRRENGRFHLHELLRQYALKKLAASPREEAACHRAHSRYYADFLGQRFPHLMGGRQRDAMVEIEPELKNIRAGWQWAVAQRALTHLQGASQPLGLFYQFQGRFLEGANAFAAAAAGLRQGEAARQRDVVLVMILVDQAWFLIRLGRLAEAEAVLAECGQIYRRRQFEPVPGHGTDPALAEGIIASIRGDHAAAARLGEEAWRRSAAAEHRWNRQFAAYLLSRAAQARGQYEDARAYAQQAHDLTQQTQDRWFRAYCHNELGNVARALGEYEAARRHYEAGFALREAFEDPEGMALALSYLGETAVLQQQYKEAQRLFRRSRDIYEEINDRGGLAAVLKGLGQAATGLDETIQAQRYLRRALQIAAEIPFLSLLFSVLLAVGNLWLRMGYRERGVVLLSFVRHHPSGEQQTKEAAARLLAECETAVSRWAFETAVQQGRESELERMIETSLAALTHPPEPPPRETPLPEPLTPREEDVLRLLARGLTNKAIAAELTVVEGTVKAHNHNIYTKLDVDNRTEAVARARELGLIE